MSSETMHATFGARLAAKRRAAGLTQDQLGEGLGADGGNVSKGGVSAWEVDRTQPSAVQITKLCERLKCSADDLLGIQKPKKKWDGKTERRSSERKAA